MNHLNIYYPPSSDVYQWNIDSCQPFQDRFTTELKFQLIACFAKAPSSGNILVGYSCWKFVLCIYHNFSTLSIPKIIMWGCCFATVQHYCQILVNSCCRLTFAVDVLKVRDLINANRSMWLYSLGKIWQVGSYLQDTMDSRKSWEMAKKKHTWKNHGICIIWQYLEKNIWYFGKIMEFLKWHMLWKLWKNCALFWYCNSMFNMRLVRVWYICSFTIDHGQILSIMEFCFPIPVDTLY